MTDLYKDLHYMREPTSQTYRAMSYLYQQRLWTVGKKSYKYCCGRLHQAQLRNKKPVAVPEI